MLTRGVRDIGIKGVDMDIWNDVKKLHDFLIINIKNKELRHCRICSESIKVKVNK